MICYNLSVGRLGKEENDRIEGMGLDKILDICYNKGVKGK
jgi:hypothetical protein